MTDRNVRRHGGDRAPRCPICGADTVAAHRPFCSERCRDVDLGRWLSGHYVIAGEPVAETEEDGGGGNDGTDV